jgi:hypothetical protein
VKYLTVREVNRIIVLAATAYPAPTPPALPLRPPTEPPMPPPLFGPNWKSREMTPKQQAAEDELTALLDAMSDEVKTDLVALMSLGRDLFGWEQHTFEQHRESIGDCEWHTDYLLEKRHFLAGYLERGLERLVARQSAGDPVVRRPRPGALGPGRQS